jgi:DNA-binding protein WhiA
MSFSKDLKQEISNIENLSNKDAVRYELIGYLMSSNINEENGKIKFSTENEYNINRFSRLLNNVNIDRYDIELQGKKYIITVNRKELNQMKNMKISEPSQEQIKCIIRGAYLGGGSINNPEKKYHLELGIKNKEDVNMLESLLKTFEIKSSVISKGNEYSIYIKDGEEIAKFLALIGANKSVLRFEEIRVQREMNNKINRLVNCESANLNKTINASIEQIEAIRKIKKNRKFEKLSGSLKEIAELRLNNPNASLIELGKMLKQPIGKSGVNYRLKKIMEIADE